MKDPIVIPPPDTPPTTYSMMSGGVAGSTLLMAGGAANLAAGFCADCFSLFNQILGGLELAAGALLLWWLISRWLRARRDNLELYRQQLEHCRQELDEYYQWLRERGRIAETDRPPGGGPPDSGGAAAS